MISVVRLVIVIALLGVPPGLYLYSFRDVVQHDPEQLQTPWFLWITPYLVAAICVFPLRGLQKYIGAIALFLFSSLMLLRVFNSASWR